MLSSEKALSSSGQGWSGAPSPLGPHAHAFLQRTIGQILASNEVFSRFETILEVSLGESLIFWARIPQCPECSRTVTWVSGVGWALAHAPVPEPAHPHPAAVVA